MKAYKFNEYQERWLHDLETTKAKQCTDFLTEDGGYCCLGRAYVANGIRAKDGAFEGEYGFLGETMAGHLKVYGNDGEITSNQPKGDSGPIRTLIGLNDSTEWSFKQIAAFIREHPRSVFKG